MKTFITLTIAKLALYAAVAGILISCDKNGDKADAYGNFEANAVIVSAQQPGIILWLNAEEGQTLNTGQVVGTVDTIPLMLQRKQALAQKQLILSKYAGIESGIAVQKQQQENVNTEIARVKRLLAGGAATGKQLDDAEAGLAIIEKQILSTKTQYSLVQAELATANANIDAINDQINRCHISNPLQGTVLQKYAEGGEMVAPGKPLYKIAPLDTLELKAYISGTQLPQVAIGDTVAVFTDEQSGTMDTVQGTVSWIASEAEFTPKIIQTREERVNLVYAVKIRVPNAHGTFKIGMPAEIRF